MYFRLDAYHWCIGILNWHMPCVKYPVYDLFHCAFCRCFLLNYNLKRCRRLDRVITGLDCDQYRENYPVLK